MLKKTLQCLEGIHLSQSGSLLMLYVDKLLNTPFRVLARMVDTLACRRVEMLLAETLQVRFSKVCISLEVHLKAEHVSYVFPGPIWDLFSNFKAIRWEELLKSNFLCV